MPGRLKRRGFYFGRRKPYTAIGITRVPCARCGKPSLHQWQVCANDGRYLGACTDCDVLLNELALKFFRFPTIALDELMEWYRDRIRRDG